MAAWHASALLVANPAQPTHVVTVDEDAVRAAVASLNSHEAYLRHVADHPKPEVMIPEILRGGGAAAGTEYAAAFRHYGL